MFFKNKNEEFIGTNEELIQWLDNQDYFNSNELREQFVKRRTIEGLDKFNKISLDKDTGTICFGASWGYLSPPNNAPSYPDTTVFKLLTDGFTEEEINKALQKTIDELEKIRDKNKDKTKKEFLSYKTKCTEISKNSHTIARQRNSKSGVFVNDKK